MKNDLKAILRTFLGIFLIFTLLVSCLTADAKIARNTTKISPDICYPKVNIKQEQYIIGYGSLMEKASRQRTTVKTGIAYPVLVKGYERGWFAKGGSVGFDTTYLGVVANPQSSFNAIIYQIPESTDMTSIDKREYFYCRQLVKPENFSILKNSSQNLRGQVWIYVIKPENFTIASTIYPIVQSYVDIFVSGCLEQQQFYNIPDFAKQCIKTTTNWSKYWVNDRIYPRRPFIYEPQAIQIDKLLKEQIPEFFREIKIE